MAKHLGLFAVLALTCLSGTAHAGVYSFGGACASLGSWSQAALNQTQTIIQVVETLKDNPDCKGIESIVPKIQIAQKQMESTPGEEERTDRTESIPNEVSALRGVAVSSPDLKEDVLKLLASRTMEGAALSSEIPMAAAGPVGAAVVGAQVLQTKMRRASLTGIEMLNQAMAVLPSYDRCLIGRPSQGLAMLGAAVKLSAAFASSEEGVASKMGDTIANLVTMLRNRKFTKALRNLDETQFWLSMSCLMETTAQSYCAAHDARTILNYGMSQMQNAKGTTGQPGNPLEGYYVLTRDIPVVSEWMQKIQFGITPKLSSDATFKNRVWTDVTSLITETNSLRGLYSEQMLTYSTLQDVASKRATLMKLIRSLTSRLLGNVEAAEQQLNFFTMTVIEEAIPFKLIGLDQIPPECASNDKGQFIMPWDVWMQNGGNFQPQFKDPDALAKVIGQQLEELIGSALTKASLYFQQRMIVDMPNLVSESVTSQTVTVVQSLTQIEKYLASLEKKIIASKDDLILIPNIRNTRARILRVLQSYQAVRDVVAKLPDDPLKEDAKVEEEIKEAYKAIIEKAYEQFNILLQKDTFLATRLGTFIHYDYAMRIKKGEDMSRYEEDVLKVSGKDLLNRILQVNSSNPTMALNDLSAAQVVNKRNLRDLEQLFRESLYPVIGELDGIVKHYKPNDLGRQMLFAQRTFRDSFKYSGSNVDFRDPFQLGVAYLWAFGTTVQTHFRQLMPATRNFLWSAYFPFQVNQKQPFARADDEFGSFDQFRAKLCTQTLGFEDRKYFAQVCRGSELKSAFDLGEHPMAARFELSVKYDKFLNDDTRFAPVKSDSICAFHNYARRNLVYWLTQDLPQATKP